jgi:predicted amidohydrolase
MRKVKICTISMNSLLRGNDWNKATIFAEAATLITDGMVDRPDLFLLPETFLTGLSAEVLANSDNYERPGSEIYQKFSGLAKKCNAYIAVPMLTQDAVGRHNSTVLFDRSGDVVFTYHKAYPTQGELDTQIIPGTQTPACYDADFGRIGFAICFDLQFQPLFRHYYDQGMELLLFSSYFPGGFILRSLAFQYSFFIVSSHAQGEESIFVDNYGRETARAGLFSQALTREINLDCAILPITHNIEKIALIKQQYAVEIEIQRPEGKMLLSSVSDEITVAELKKEFELISLGEFFKNQHLC